jgi:hypothetical protein
VVDDDDYNNNNINTLHIPELVSLSEVPRNRDDVDAQTFGVFLDLKLEKTQLEVDIQKGRIVLL